MAKHGKYITHKFPKQWFRYALLPALMAIAVSVPYSKVLAGFFQQDEWLSFARHIVSNKEGGIAFLVDAFLPSVGHYQPLNTITIHTLFLLFGLRYTAYALVSIVLHIINVVLVFFLAKKIFQNRLLAFLTSLLFGMTAAIYQATSWVLADIGIHFATMFGVVSFLFFFNFLTTHKGRDFTLSMIFLFVSLLYKEITLGLFVLYPLMYFLFREKTSKKYPVIIVGLGLLYMLVRGAMIFIPQAYSKDVLITQSQPLEYLIYNLVTFPFKAVAQVLIPARVLLDSGYSITNFFPAWFVGESDTTARDRFVEGRFVESLSIIISSIIGVLALRMWYRNKNTPLAKYGIFGLLIILFNSSIYALAPERSGQLSIIDSRHLYFVAIGAAILIVSLLWQVRVHSVVKATVILVIILSNIYWLNQELTDIALAGSVRKNILQQMYAAYPVLPERVVFYTQSDTSLYGLPPEERILPFQSGFGQTLLVWYYPTEKFSLEFYKRRFLWEITDQGYRESEGRGFGYFRDFTLLQNFFQSNTIATTSVVAFAWDNDQSVLIDISREVRQKLVAHQ